MKENITEEMTNDMKARKMINAIVRNLRIDGNSNIVNDELTIVYPIQITHIADMDGVTCALLEGFVAEVLNHMMLPSYIIPVGNSGIYDTVKEHLSIILAPISIEYIKNSILEKKEFIVEENITFSKVNLIPWLIITDISTHSDEILSVEREFKSFCKAQRMKNIIWKIDHHISNGESLLLTLPSTGMESFPSIPDLDICKKSFGLGDLKTLFGDKYVSDLFDEINYGYNSWVIKKMLQDKRDKAASFIFFVLLFATKLFPMDLGSFTYQMAKFVSIVSAADTYSFDFYDENDPFYGKVKYPRAYSSYFKFMNGGSSLDSFMKISRKFLLSICQDYHRGEYIENTPDQKYGPYFGSDDVKILDIVYSEEKIKYMNAVFHCAYMEIDKDKKFFEPLQQLTDFEFTDSMKKMIDKFMDKRILEEQKVSRYAVFVIENGEDVSMIGNTLLKQTSDLDIALFLYPASRTLSFRSNNLKTVYVDKIAKGLGGGGHYFSSGCKLSEDDFLTLLKIYWNLPYLSTASNAMTDIKKGIEDM